MKRIYSRYDEIFQKKKKKKNNNKNESFQSDSGKKGGKIFPLIKNALFYASIRDTLFRKIFDSFSLFHFRFVERSKDPKIVRVAPERATGNSATTATLVSLLWMVDVRLQNP